MKKTFDLAYDDSIHTYITSKSKTWFSPVWIRKTTSIFEWLNKPITQIWYTYLILVIRVYILIKQDQRDSNIEGLKEEKVQIKIWVCFCIFVLWPFTKSCLYHLVNAPTSETVTGLMQVKFIHSFVESSYAHSDRVNHGKMNQLPFLVW